ncbi:MAG: TonB-dependent siderophore receptor [Novosphingobium sp.]
MMKIRSAASTLSVAILGATVAAPAQAQSNADSAVESAEDAFGTSTGHDNIGVYDENNVRGFSPGSAGNFRMEGMYFDIQGGLGNRVIDGETIRVGTAAQGYAFPAPTGVVDLTLKKAGDKTSISPFISADSFGTVGYEVDAQIPLAGKTLGLATGFGVYNNQYANGGGSVGINVGGVLRWRPAPAVELLTFANHQQFWDDTSTGILISNGNFLPPRFKVGVDTSPVWARNEHHADTYGTVGHASLGDWTLRAGLFRSQYSQDSGYANLIFVNQDRSTERQVYASPASRSASWSGEFRVSRRFSEGPRQHLITLSLRGRSIDAHYGGGDLVSLGMADIDEVLDVPKPNFNFTALTDDFTRQTTAGLSYSLKWKGIGEFTAGAQRTHYVKELGTSRTTDATLPYFSAALTVIPKVVLYGSYVRGLEDSGSAPGYASNANEILEASRTSQYDFGIRWSPVKDTTFIVGYFRIAKPLIDIDTANHYGFLGSQVNKGIEFSITSNPTKSLRIVAGGVWLDPRITASPTIAQPLGERPVGQPQLRTRFNINWTLPFARAVTLDAYVNHDSGAYGTIDNAVYAPGSTRVGVGARYRFKIGGHDVTAKVGLYNIADVFMYVPVGSGVYGYNIPRNVQAWITTDF